MANTIDINREQKVGLWHNMDLTKAIELTVKEFPGKGSDPTKFMKYVASAESNYGNYDKDDALSYGAFQIDPIRYYDIVQNPDKVNTKRIDKANKFLREQGYGDDFDISKLAVYNPETKKYSSKSKQATMHDPLINSVLMRLALMQDPNPKVPTGMDEMQDYYFDFWKPKVDSEYKRSEANRKYLKYNQSGLDSIKADNKAFNAMLKVNSFKF